MSLDFTAIAKAAIKKSSCCSECAEEIDYSEVDEILQGVCDDFGLTSPVFDYLYDYKESLDDEDEDFDIEDLGLSEEELRYILNG